MELQIEKQKHQTLLEKYKDANKEGDREVQQELNNVKQKHKNEMAEFHKQIAENKARFRETENDLRQEIQSLKKVNRNHILSGKLLITPEVTDVVITFYMYMHLVYCR